MMLDSYDFDISTDKVEKLVNEFSDLAFKMLRLKHAIETHDQFHISEYQLIMLHDQYKAMFNYINVLQARINDLLCSEE